MKREPKYQMIIDHIKEQIESGELTYGSKIESENMLMKRFGVSRQTVRHGLLQLINNGVLESRQGSGTFVVDKGRGQILGRIRTKKIAVMTTYVNDYIFSPIIQAIEEVLSDEGYTMHLTFTYNSLEKEREILERFIKENDIDGLIAEPTKSNLPNPNIERYKVLEESGIPIIQINTFYGNLKAPHISLDDKAAGYMATKYLIEKGHTSIGSIFKCDDGQGSLRYAGYIKALMEYEIPIKDYRISWIDTEDLRGNIEGFTGILNRLQDCTACLCYNDEVAGKLMEACGVSNIEVPKRLSIIGIDNANLAKYTSVPLTTIKNPVKDIGKLAALKMLDILNRKQVSTMELEPVIVERKSVRTILMKET